MSVYRATSSLDVVELPDDAILLRSDASSCKVEGESARLLASEVLPRLGDWMGIDELSERLAGYDLESLAALLDSLVEARLLLSRSEPPPRLSPEARVLADIGIDEGLCARRLAEVRIAVLGSGAAARLLTEWLGRLGAGTIHRFAGADGIASEDQAILPLSKESLVGLSAELDLMLVAVDRAMLAARHWANQAALATGCPAVFVDLAAIEGVVGPTVLPGESGCYTCFRMRHLATSDLFTEVMAHERHLDARKDAGFERPAFPGLELVAAGAALAEATRLLFAPLTPSLVNAVLRIDPLSGSFERHQFLRQPDCPHCAKIDVAVRSGG